MLGVVRSGYGMVASDGARSVPRAISSEIAAYGTGRPTAPAVIRCIGHGRCAEIERTRALRSAPRKCSDHALALRAHMSDVVIPPWNSTTGGASDRPHASTNVSPWDVGTRISSCETGQSASIDR